MFKTLFINSLWPRMLAKIALMLCLAGCSSLRDKADNLMEQRAYKEAEKIYREVLAKDPHDTRAILGLKKSREASISDELLEVRRHRLSGNSDQASEELRDILNSLKEWHLYPSGPVAFTQNEEIDFAVHSIRLQSIVLLQQRRPLKIAYLLNHFQDFFQERNLLLLAELRNSASSQGIELCKKQLSLTGQTLTFYREFLFKTCRFWGDSSPENKVPILHGLASALDLKEDVSGLPAGLKLKFENAIQHIFAESPWFDSAEIKKWPISYTGSYVYLTKKREATFTYAYQEQEPFMSFEPVIKHRSILVPVTTQTLSPQGNTQTVTTSHLQDETYTEMENVTRTREVTKSLDYQGIEIEQQIALKTTAFEPAEMMRPSIQFFGSSSDQNLTAESQTQIPAIGLFAKIAKINNENDWFDKILQNWGRQNLEHWRDIWVQKNCQNFSSTWSREHTANSIFACLRERSRPAPSFVNQWLTQNLGVDSSQLQTLDL